MQISHLNTNKTRLLYVAFCAALLSPPPSQAASCSFNNIGGQLVNFGTYTSALQGSVPVTGTGEIVLECDSLVSVTLSASTGNGTYANRLLQDGSNSLSYNIYRDPLYQVVFGNGPDVLGASQAVITTLCPATGECVTNVYGRIDGGQNGPGGEYTDTLTITAEF